MAAVRDQRGIVLPLMAISILVLLGVAGLVVDLGQAYARKSELQNVLDAAALSGAKVLSDTGSADQAQSAAIATYNSNMPALFLNGDSVPVVELSDTYDPFVPGGTEPKYIRVRVDQVEFATWFAHVLPGLGDTLTVGGSALAGPSPPLGTDPDSEICGIVPMMVCGDPNAPNFGYSVGVEEEEVLKSGSDSSGTEVGPGNFQLIALGCGNGADCVREGLAGSYEACTSEGSSITTEPGNTVGPVFQGLNTRFGMYNGPVDSSIAKPDTITEYDYEPGSGDNNFWHADYQERNEEGDYDYPEPEGVPNRRMLAVPIGDCSTTTEGRGEVEVLGVGCFFLTRPTGQNGQQEIYGQFVEECSAGGTASEDPVTDPTSGSTLYKVVLYKDPDSDDS